MHAQESCQVTPLPHGFVDAVRHFLDLVPFADVGFDFGLDPSADFVAESGMGFVEVWGVVLSIQKLAYVSYDAMQFPSTFIVSKTWEDIHLDTKLGPQRESNLQKDPMDPPAQQSHQAQEQQHHSQLQASQPPF